MELAKVTGLPVLLCGDNDEVGREAMRKVRLLLRKDHVDAISTHRAAPPKGSVADLEILDLQALLRNKLSVSDRDPSWQKPIRSRAQYLEYKCPRPKRNIKGAGDLSGIWGLVSCGNSGTGKTHVALGLGLAACQKGMSVGFTTAAALVHELMEARDDRRLLNLQRQLARLRLLIIDELGFVPLSTTGAELLFEVFSQRYERGSVLVTTNLPFDEWTEVFGSERLTGALLDRLTHHVHILEMNGESYRLKHSRQSAASRVSDDPVDS